jgi:hypothetical protein
LGGKEKCRRSATWHSFDLSDLNIVFEIHHHLKIRTSVESAAWCTHRRKAKFMGHIDFGQVTCYFSLKSYPRCFMALNQSIKMRRYRQKLRASGLRPIQLWLPDTRSKAIVDEVRKQSLHVSSDSRETMIMNFIEGAFDDTEWE